MKNVLSALILLIHLSGCIYMSSNQKIKTDKNEEISVKFESSAASSVFHSKIEIHNLGKYRGIHAEINSVMIPFLVFINHRTFFKTEYYNYKIKQTDINKDGIVTLKEANKLRFNSDRMPTIKTNNDFDCYKLSGKWVCD
ncbi:MAG: hypothetical protein ACJA0S_000564 [Rickettsiales bacterium]|jgi:hypothetical protein